MRETTGAALCESPFFVAFNGRSGSSHLRTLLHQHPEVFYLDEPFEPKKLQRRSNGRAFVRSKIDEVFYCRETQARGVSLKPEHAFRQSGAPRQATRLLPRQSTCIILRRDEVNSTISKLMYRQVKAQTGRANVPVGTQITLKPIVVPPQKFVEILLRRRKALAHFESWARPLCAKTVEIHYEDLVQREKEVLDFIAATLSLTVPFSSLDTRHVLQKAIKGDPWDMIVNREEVQAALATIEVGCLGSGETSRS